MNRHTHHTPRGFAMLLVLISLAVATILATAYLASRDNSAMIGQNVTSGSSAKWAALATLKSGIATLETETDWRNDHTNGVVFANASLSGATVNLEFMDRTTGAPPTDDTTDVQVTATATVAGITESVVAYATVPPLDQKPDLDLSEFVVFATDKLRVRDTSLITRWHSSPRSGLGRGLALGTLSRDAGAIELTDYGVAVDSTAFALPGASGMLVSNGGPGSVQVVELPDTVVVPNPPDSGTSPPDGSTSDLTEGDGDPVPLMQSDHRYDNISFENGSRLRLRNMTLTADGDLTFKSGSKLIIQGDVKIVAHEKFEFEADTLIELREGATLTVYAGDDVRFDDAEIREKDDTNTGNTSGTATWFDPTRVMFYELDSDSGTWAFDGGAVFKGSVYAPNKNVDIDNGSAVYGRILAREVDVQNGSAIYYDHTLDSRTGYTVFDSLIYNEDGLVRSTIKAIDNLGETTDVVDDILEDLVGGVGDLLGGLLGGGDDDDDGPNDPTPRTVDVSYEIVSLSSDVPDWESKATMITAGGGEDD